MEDTRQRILNAAGVEFAERGYRGATIRTICRKAGVNVAAVNYYFGGKEGLYKEVIIASHPANIDDGASFPENASAREKLRAFVHAFLTHVRSIPSDSWRLRLMIRELTNPIPACREPLKAAFQARFDELLKIFRELVPNAPEVFRKRLAVGIFGQCIVYRRDGIPQLLLGEAQIDRHFGIETLTDHIVTMTLRAVGLESPFDFRSREERMEDDPVEGGAA